MPTAKPSTAIDPNGPSAFGAHFAFLATSSPSSPSSTSMVNPSPFTPISISFGLNSNSLSLANAIIRPPSRRPTKSRSCPPNGLTKVNVRPNRSVQNKSRSGAQSARPRLSSEQRAHSPEIHREHSRSVVQTRPTYQHSHHHRAPFDDDFSFISPCVKYSLFFFNLIFWIIGSTLIGLGSWSLLEEYDYNLFKFQNVFDFLLHISLGLIIAGAIIFSMSFMGCIGALRENLCLIKIYSFLLLLLFIGEVILSSLAFIFPSSLLHFLKDRLSKDVITKYRDDSNLQNLIDILQMEFKCCGISDNGYKDWSKNIYFNCTLINPSSERCAVPFSCCRDLNTNFINSMCGHNMQNLSSVVEINKYVYTRGCVEAVSELVERNMNLVAVICLSSALAQLFAMFLARSLQGQIFAQRARWM